MPSPVAHSLAGLAVLWLFRILPRSPGVAGRYVAVLLAVAVVSVAADFDFLPGFFIGRPGYYHRGITHSFGAALIIGALAVAYARARGWASPGRVGLIIAVVYGSHVLLDLLTIDYGDQIGMPAFWPLTGAHVVSPVHVFLYIRRAPGAADFITSQLSAHNLSAVLWEAAVMGAVLLVLRVAGFGPPTGGWRTRQDRPS